MVEVRQTQIYRQWFSNLRDPQAQARINLRIRRLSMGNFGDVKPIGKRASELRINYGPGYRVYFIQRGEALVILLAGGDKNSQRRDIQIALDILKDI